MIKMLQRAIKNMLEANFIKLKNKTKQKASAKRQKSQQRYRRCKNQVEILELKYTITEIKAEWMKSTPEQRDIGKNQ